MRHLTLLLALSLIACPRPDDTEPVETEDTEDTGDTETVDTDDTEETGDTGDTEDTGDTDTDETGDGWLTLAADCTPPSPLPDDPLVETGNLQITQTEPGGYFMELVDLEWSGEVVYGVGQGGLLLFDVSDPANPTELSHHTGSHTRFHRVEVVDERHVAVTHRDLGLEIVDVSDTSKPATVTRLVRKGWEGLALHGDYLLVTSRTDGLVVLDVSDPTSPTEVGTTAGLSSPWELSEVTSDGWVYAADNGLGVVPIDVSDPTSPTVGTAVELGGAALHVEAEGDWLYAAAGSLGVVILDRSTPGAPTVSSTVSTGGSAVMVDVEDDLLYVVDHEGLTVVDVSDPADPTYVGRQYTPQFALAVAAGEESAWVGDWSILSGWKVDPLAGAGELDTAVRDLELPEGGGSLEVELHNRGGGALTLHGGMVLDERVTLEASAESIPTGESALLRLSWEPEDEEEKLDTELCLALDDPDRAYQPFRVRSGTSTPPIGDPAPDFALEDLDGNTHRLSEQLGSPVLLAYFATW